MGSKVVLRRRLSFADNEVILKGTPGKVTGKHEFLNKAYYLVAFEGVSPDRLVKDVWSER
jgi:hypothetical protein